ncbi:nuclease SbcCD subunit D [Paraoerskovia sediminicola]|uniref:Nuclease SbcCD subunit D n=1 Tax=Paraoerskovia sediminicola TaxID=1138587 RepID=A0ABN6XBQ3_9CELL|nr:exonuclease SbcCD subunit D [Paraoerskovia sediminicola]BDZ42219.1 nuclease SbcCD subunit D [Paraoerskovia sediminicola]
MRILHTSDWHLGRTLHGVDLLEHQRVFLEHLVATVRERSVDAVLVAGDVYDRAIPSVEAVESLGTALRRLAELTTVVLTPGNHDSATRLGFAAPLLRDELHILSSSDVGRPVEIQGRHGEAPLHVYGFPYLEPESFRSVLADDPQKPLLRSHAAVTAAAMRRVRADRLARECRALSGEGPARAVVMAHAFVVGGQASDSERDIRVGGVDSVPAGVFAGCGVDYVALGHLHGPQKVTVPEAASPEALPGPPPSARYSGSPLAYSFSEMNHTKSTVLLDLDAPDDQRIELVPAPVPRRMADLSGTFEEVMGARGEAHTGDWLRLTVTDPQRPDELVARVRSRFPHALQIRHEPASRDARETVRVVERGADPLVVVRDFVTHVTGAAPTPEESGVLAQAHEAVLAAEKSA